MSAPTLKSYRFRVYGGDAENPEMFEVHAFGRDVQRTEAEFASRKWGSATDRPMTSAAMTTYFALKRANKYAGTWEEFENWYLSVEPFESVNAVPTEAGAEPA
jgi:hypothetical protein